MYDGACFADRGGLFTADLAISLDVIFHLIEDAVFNTYMTHLFAAGRNFVIIHATNREISGTAPHVRHRHFTQWAEKHAQNWRLLEVTPGPNPGPVRADFFTYQRVIPCAVDAHATRSPEGSVLLPRVAEYNLMVTNVEPDSLRSRILYEAYALQHAASGGDEAAAFVCRRGIRPHLSALAAGSVIHCGCAHSIRQLAPADGFESVRMRSSPPVAHGLARPARVMAWQVVSACYRIVLALEAYVPRGHIVALNLTFAACKGVALANSAEKTPA